MIQRYPVWIVDDMILNDLEFGLVMKNATPLHAMGYDKLWKDYIFEEHKLGKLPLLDIPLHANAGQFIDYLNTKLGRWQWRVFSYCEPDRYYKRSLLQRKLWCCRLVSDEINIDAFISMEDKLRHCKAGSSLKRNFTRPVLVDTDQLAVNAWTQKGGIGILYTDLESTITKLDEAFKT